MKKLLPLIVFLGSAALLAPMLPARADTTLLNVSYDPTREFYQEFNGVFARYWQTTRHQAVTIQQSHGGSGKQARSVIDGLEADVVTLGLGYDIEALQNAGLVKPGWETKFPHHSSPYTSTVVFVVRKGNPKGIKDWPDIVRPGVSIITSNPKTSAGGRWAYMAAWGYARIQRGATDVSARDYVTKLYRNVPVLDTGARGSTTTFAQREIGDVLLAWENEAYLIQQEFGRGKFDVVIPSVSILAEPPVAVVDKIVDKRGTRAVATAYLQYLYSPEGQLLAAKHHYRPLNPKSAGAFANDFPKIKLFTVDSISGSWKGANDYHFKDGGAFDQIIKRR